MSKYLFLLGIPLTFCVKIYGQNVGIGTNAPSEKLHVAGNIKADTLKPQTIKLTSNAGAGKILTSDATGNASWQANNSAAAAGNIGFGVWGDCATNGNISEYQPVVDETGYDDYFGASVSISGNFAIIGSTQDDVNGVTDQGSASIYQYTSNGWVFMQKLTDATGAAEDAFGNSVAISGNYAIVGATKDDVSTNSNQGSVSIFHYDGNSWVLQQKLTDATGAAGDNFGYSVSLSGDFIVIGAPLDDGENTDEGSVIIYRLNGNNTWIFQQKITVPALTDNSNFGHAVSMSGDRFISGAPFEYGLIGPDVGSVRIYHFDGNTWVEKAFFRGREENDTEFGSAVSISGDIVAVGAPFLNNLIGDDGAVYIYKYAENVWDFMTRVGSDLDPAQPYVYFGKSVSISGNYLSVGMSGYNYSGNGWRTKTNMGASYIYLRMGRIWQRLQFIVDPAGLTDDIFGSAIQIDGATNRFLIGAPGHGGGDGKVLFGKVN